MERKFYPENFEKFLKGHADQFKMTPSKKVWHGIYNDLHPGRRWPSIAVSMIFIFTLVIVGHLNTNNGHYTQPYDLASHNLNTAKQSKTISKHSYRPQVNNNNAVNIAVNVPANTNPLLSVIKNESTEPNAGEKKPGNNALDNQTEIRSIDKVENNPIQTISNTGNVIPSQDMRQIKTEEIISGSIPVNNDKEINPPVTEGGSEMQVQGTANAVPKLKKINPVTWTYYAAPSLSYRSLSDNGLNDAVIHKPMLGLEAGTTMSFNILKKLQFTTGLQLNYSGYRIKANNTHPIVATLVLNSETGAPFSAYSTVSSYGNRTGTELTTLRNYSLQASLPIGLQYVFAESDNIKFGAAAAFQPSLVLSSKGYLLSTDKRNYLTAPDLFRTWNMNTNFTTYVLFESNSLKWQIGPQVRYQLLSTYTNRYPVKEHLVNYGIRVAISKNPD